MDLNIVVGGEAGQGIQTVGFVLGKALSRVGWHVFADQDYESRIRGGHNFFRIRISDSEVLAQNEQVDILVALNRETIDLHRRAVKPDGSIIVDLKALEIKDQGNNFLDVPLEKLALDISNSKLMVNSVAVGVVSGLLGIDSILLERVLRWHFAKGSEKIRGDNVKSALAGLEYTLKNHPGKIKTKFQPSNNLQKMFITGNEALASGAVAAGCKFASIYPMTPITSILEFLVEKGYQHNIAVLQPEDEIAAINNVVGAAYTGVRAMTATSGSGYVLMIEGIGLAGMTEIPVVVVLGQRPGPAVGLPTRTEQGELLLAIRTGTGEFPRAVLAPANHEDAFWLTVKAFNLAEKYQIPVIILTDTHLANSYKATEKFDMKQVTIDRGELFVESPSSQTGEYKRYRLTETGVSPRAFPMQGNALVVADSDEHEDSGHLTESALTRTMQVSKRLRKYQELKKAISQPRFRKTPGAAFTLIGWGSTYGAIWEASEILSREGLPNNQMHFSEIWPFPSEFVAEALKDSSRVIVIENNATGQLAELIHSETGIKAGIRVNKWDGRPMTAHDIVERVKGELNNA